MKYVVINSKKRVERVITNDTFPVHSALNTVIEITDEQYEQIEERVAQRLVTFFSNDIIFTGEEWVWENMTPDQKYKKKLQEGFSNNGIVFGITEKDLTQWTQALTALSTAEAIGNDITTMTVQDLIGPVLDINGEPVANMTVLGFRQLMMQLIQYIGVLRSTR